MEDEAGLAACAATARRSNASPASGTGRVTANLPHTAGSASSTASSYRHESVSSRVLLAVAVLLVLGAGAFLVWTSTPLGPMPEAVATLRAGPEVRVETEPWLVFRPAGTSSPPGGGWTPSPRPRR